MKNLKRKLVILAILSSNYLLLFSQADSIRVTIQSGNHLDFVFNSFKKLDQGTTYINFTRFSVSYHNTADPTWDLRYTALSNFIVGDGGNNLDLATLELTPSCSSGGTLSGKVPLIYNIASPGYLITNAPEGDNQIITITYDCGTNSSYKLFGEIPDYYYVEIEFYFEYGP